MNKFINKSININNHLWSRLGLVRLYWTAFIYSLIRVYDIHSYLKLPYQHWNNAQCCPVTACWQLLSERHPCRLQLRRTEPPPQTWPQTPRSLQARSKPWEWPWSDPGSSSVPCPRPYTLSCFLTSANKRGIGKWL